MQRLTATGFLVTSLYAGPELCAQATPSDLARQVAAAQSSFAASVGLRDTAAFAALVGPDAVFFGDRKIMRGKRSVVESRQPLFAGPRAP